MTMVDAEIKIESPLAQVRKTRTRKPCIECGVLCRSRWGLCVACRDESPAELLDGRWVNRGGVQVWQEAS